MNNNNDFFPSVLLPCYNVIYNDVDDTLDLTHIYT